MKTARLLSIIAISLLLYFCKAARTENTQQSADGEGGEGYRRPDIAWMKRFRESPVVSPEQSLKLFKTEEGVSISLVAAEPLVQTPVNLLFDSRGRVWVTEMTGYMPDVTGKGEDVPNGRIVILDDTDGDGMMDKRKIFLDSLVLPRSICFIEDGILVAEPPNLWFYKVKDDQPGERTLVDSVYAVGGNVEHQPNGLLRAIDNWIYNAKSNKRYRKEGDTWKIEHTHSRGQWGLSQDNQGRLYYNHNSANVLGDHFLPGFGEGNPHQKTVTGFNARIVPDNRVYPLRPTPGVNRGYKKGVLDDSLRLVNFTAACGPLVYRGDLFGPEYQSNIFVPEPSGNLIKRNIIREEGYLTHGKQAYAGREFVASTDERFRPVTISNGPDGALYVLDMYRGIIQHKTYVTPYLRQEITERDLTLPLHLGRIYRIAPEGAPTAAYPRIDDGDEQLIALLGHDNGWLRDYAQQTLIDQKRKYLAPRLREIASASRNDYEIIHCLWTLEGLGVLSADDVLPLFHRESFRQQVLAFGLTPSVINEGNYARFTATWQELIRREQHDVFPYIAFALSTVKSPDNTLAWNLWQQLSHARPHDPYLASAIISNLHDREAAFLRDFEKHTPDTSVVIARQLKTAIENGIREKNNRNQAALAREYPNGAEFYNTICQTCHGADGNGVQGLAPPLNRSEWVTGKKEVLTAIVLFGLTGPVKVNNYLYQSPEISTDMPGIGFDADLSDDHIAEMLSYIRKLWENDADPISAKEVENVRKRFANREKAFTVQELEQLL